MNSISTGPSLEDLAVTIERLTKTVSQIQYCSKRQEKISSEQLERLERLKEQLEVGKQSVATSNTSSTHDEHEASSFDGHRLNDAVKAESVVNQQDILDNVNNERRDMVRGQLTFLLEHIQIISHELESDALVKVEDLVVKELGALTLSPDDDDKEELLEEEEGIVSADDHELPSVPSSMDREEDPDIDEETERAATLSESRETRAGGHDSNDGAPSVSTGDRGVEDDDSNNQESADIGRQVLTVGAAGAAGVVAGSMLNMIVKNQDDDSLDHQDTRSLGQTDSKAITHEAALERVRTTEDGLGGSSESLQPPVTVDELQADDEPSEQLHENVSSINHRNSAAADEGTSSEERAGTVNTEEEEESIDKSRKVAPLSLDSDDEDPVDDGSGSSKVLEDSPVEVSDIGTSKEEGSAGGSSGNLDELSTLQVEIPEGESKVTTHEAAVERVMATEDGLGGSSENLQPPVAVNELQACYEPGEQQPENVSSDGHRKSAAADEETTSEERGRTVHTDEEEEESADKSREVAPLPLDSDEESPVEDESGSSKLLEDSPVDALDIDTSEGDGSTGGSGCRLDELTNSQVEMTDNIQITHGGSTEIEPEGVGEEEVQQSPQDGSDLSVEEAQAPASTGVEELSQNSSNRNGVIGLHVDEEVGDELGALLILSAAEVSGDEPDTLVKGDAADNTRNDLLHDGLSEVKDDEHGGSSIHDSNDLAEVDVQADNLTICSSESPEGVVLPARVDSTGENSSIADHGSHQQDENGGDKLETSARRNCGSNLPSDLSQQETDGDYPEVVSKDMKTKDEEEFHKSATAAKDTGIQNDTDGTSANDEGNHSPKTNGSDLEEDPTIAVISDGKNGDLLKEDGTPVTSDSVPSSPEGDSEAETKDDMSGEDDGASLEKSANDIALVDEESLHLSSETLGKSPISSNVDDGANVTDSEPIICHNAEDTGTASPEEEPSSPNIVESQAVTKAATSQAALVKMSAPEDGSHSLESGNEKSPEQSVSRRDGSKDNIQKNDSLPQQRDVSKKHRSSRNGKKHSHERRSSRDLKEKKKHRSSRSSGLDVGEGAQKSGERRKHKKSTRDRDSQEHTKRDHKSHGRNERRSHENRDRREKGSDNPETEPGHPEQRKSTAHTSSRGDIQRSEGQPSSPGRRVKAVEGKRRDKYDGVQPGQKRSSDGHPSSHSKPSTEDILKSPPRRRPDLSPSQILQTPTPRESPRRHRKSRHHEYESPKKSNRKEHHSHSPSKHERDKSTRSSSKRPKKEKSRRRDHRSLERRSSKSIHVEEDSLQESLTATLQW